MSPYIADDFEKAYDVVRGAGRVVLEGNDLHLLMAALRIAARCAAAGLLSDPPTAWIAPMIATDAMLSAGDKARCDHIHCDCDENQIWRAMRDAYLKEQSGK